jgi:signal peptidase I
MAKRRDSAYIYFAFVIVFLLLNLFVLNISAKLQLLPIFIIIFLLSFIFFKFRKDKTYARIQVTITMLLIGIVQIVLYLLTGFLEGFSKNAISMSFNRFLTVILPIILILVVIELLRYMISVKFEKNNLIRILSITMFVLFDVTLFGSNVNFNSLDSVLEFLGITFFPSLVSNIVFDDMVVKYGYKPILVYRLLTTLCYYMLPIVPNMYILFRAIARIVIPLIFYFILSYMYDRVTFQEALKVKPKISISSIIILILVIIMAGLISCEFRYGILTIGSGSMTGTLNKGDIAFFEKFNGQELEIGDIIIFKRGKRNIVHRITQVGLFNDEYVYITKGDKNKVEDNGYVYQKDIQGIVHYRIKYIGYPSIWIRNLFN